jgi:serine/threonine-protein kinase
MRVASKPRMTKIGRVVGPENEVGMVLAERYRLEALLGSGMMGAVYRATDLDGAQPCAVKLLRRSLRHQPAHFRRFLDEMQLMSRLWHPNIVELKDFGCTTKGIPYLVMELLTGENLYSLLQRQPCLPVPRALSLIRQAGQALHALHSAAIIHRDLKPGNLVLHQQVGRRGREPSSEQLKLIDFGLATPLAELAVHSHDEGLVIGTPSYLAPEATWGDGSQVDARADQWSLAVIAYRLLSGVLPFTTSDDDPQALLPVIRTHTPLPLAERLPGLAPQIATAVMTALRKNRTERFPSVHAFVRALDGLLPPAALDTRFLALSVELPSGAQLSPVASPIGAAPGPPQRRQSRRSQQRYLGPAQLALAMLSLTAERRQPSPEGLPDRQALVAPSQEPLAPAGQAEAMVATTFANEPSGPALDRNTPASEKPKRTSRAKRGQKKRHRADKPQQP